MPTGNAGPAMHPAKRSAFSALLSDSLGTGRTGAAMEDKPDGWCLKRLSIRYGKALSPSDDGACIRIRVESSLLPANHG